MALTHQVELALQVVGDSQYFLKFRLLKYLRRGKFDCVHPFDQGVYLLIVDVEVLLARPDNLG